MKKNIYSVISIISCLFTTAICCVIAPAKRKNILKCLPLSVCFAAMWGHLIDLKADAEDTNKLVKDVIKNNINTSPRFKLDELDDEDEDFREI